MDDPAAARDPAALGAVLLALYDQASRAPLGLMKDELLRVVRTVLPFDSAIWGTGSPDPPVITAIAALDLPRDVLLHYGYWRSQDVLHDAAVARQGVAVRHEDLGPRSLKHASEIYRKFCGPAGLEHTLAVARVDPVTHVGELVMLFRSDPSRPFSETERDLLTLLAPHLVGAWSNRMISSFAGAGRGGENDAASGRSPSHALIDDQGHVHGSDMAFGASMRAVFPDWDGPLLPPVLCGALAGDRWPVRKRDKTFRLLKGTDRHVLKVADSNSGALSPAEHRVAERFASGHTASQVAIALGLSRLTVRNQITAIYAKLGLRSKAELARWIERGR